MDKIKPVKYFHSKWKEIAKEIETCFGGNHEEVKVLYKQFKLMYIDFAGAEIALEAENAEQAKLLTEKIKRLQELFGEIVRLKCRLSTQSKEIEELRVLLEKIYLKTITQLSDKHTMLCKYCYSEWDIEKPEDEWHTKDCYVPEIQEKLKP